LGIADDDHDSALLLATLLNLALPEFAALVAYGGRAAVDLSIVHGPAALVLDIEMPVKDGFHAAAEIKALPDRPTPLLIALSGSVPEMAFAKKAGLFDHVLAKPVDFAQLLRLLKESLGPAPQLPPRND
jgi:CheY-like chemotaxis protein